MHPSPSVIIFTALSGLGFGLLVFLGLKMAYFWSKLGFRGPFFTFFSQYIAKKIILTKKTPKYCKILVYFHK